MIRTMHKVVDGMVVHERDIKRNLELTHGTATAPRVKDLLIQHGLDPEKAYKICQELSFKAINKGVCFIDLIKLDSRVPVAINENKMLDRCYEECYQQVQYVDEIFDRFIQTSKGG